MNFLFFFFLELLHANRKQIEQISAWKRNLPSLVDPRERGHSVIRSMDDNTAP